MTIMSVAAPAHRQSILAEVLYIVFCKTMVSYDDRAHLWPGQPHSKRPANVQKSLTAQWSTTRVGCATSSSGTALIAALQKLWRFRLPLPYNVATSSIRMFTDSESQQNPQPFFAPPPGLERGDGENDVDRDRMCQRGAFKTIQNLQGLTVLCNISCAITPMSSMVSTK